MNENKFTWKQHACILQACCGYKSANMEVGKERAFFPLDKSGPPRHEQPYSERFHALSFTDIGFAVEQGDIFNLVRHVFHNHFGLYNNKSAYLIEGQIIRQMFVMSYTSEARFRLNHHLAMGRNYPETTYHEKLESHLDFRHELKKVCDFNGVDIPVFEDAEKLILHHP